MSNATQKISSVTDLIKRLNKIRSNNKSVWFRGQAVNSWKLLPQLSRKPDLLNREHELITRFKQNSLLWLEARPADDWEWLFIMQHYGVPTRLLDWSENPLYALWFAVSDKKHEELDGALWALNPVKLNTKANIVLDNDTEVPGIGDEHTKPYSPDYFLLDRKTELPPIAVIAPRTSKRMLSQLGVFTVFHRKVEPIESNARDGVAVNWIIPSQAKGRILQELELFGINRLQLFPELHVLGDSLKGSI